MGKVSPTRMALLERRSRISLAENGVAALRSKRDALRRELMQQVLKLRDLWGELESVARGANNSLIRSTAQDGRPALLRAALTARREISLEVRQRMVWGVRVPEVDWTSVERDFRERGGAPTSSSARIDATARGFERVLDATVSLAPTQITVRRLGHEIRRTSRRINTIEQVLLTRLHAEVSRIELSLEEREREDLFRLKRFKARKQE